MNFGQEEVTDASQAMDRVQNRQPSMARLKVLVSKTEGEQRAELLFRLAELLYANGRDYRLIEEYRFDQDYERCFDDSDCDENLLKADYRESTPVWEKAAGLYQMVVTGYPRYARADEAVFFLAAVQADLGELDKALENRKILVRTYPESVFAPDAYILIGERYFDENMAFKALRAYQKASQFPEHDKYAYSLYMLAWSQYNVGDLDAGIITLRRVYDLARATGDPLALEEDSVRDLVQFYTDNDDVEGAIILFTGIGRMDLIPAAMERGALLLADRGEYLKAAILYRKLILENPSTDRAVEFHHEIVRAYRRLDDHERYVAELDRFVEDYGPGAAWRASREESVVADADSRIERAVRDGAWSYHERARKQVKARRDPSAFQAHARHLYGTWLTAYPADIHRYDVHHAYAELLYDLALFEEAYDEYREVVAIDPTGKYSEESARNALFAADELDDLGRYVDAAEQYAVHFPNGKDVGSILYGTGHKLYEAEQYPRAADLFERVIRLDPTAREAELAANLMMDVFVVLEQWEELEKRSRFYFEMPGLGSKSFKRDTFAVYQNARLKRIETELIADRGAAADAFVAWVEEFPEAEKAAMALNNAAVYYDELDRFDDALKVRHILVEDSRFGDRTDYYFQHLAALGYAYEQIADFAVAAEWYERLVREFGDDQDQSEAIADALHISAVFRDAMGEWKVSLAHYEAFIDAYPEDERVLDMRLTIGRIFEDQGKWERAASTFRGIHESGDELTSEYRFFARIHHGRALEQLGKTSEAAAVYAETSRLYRKHLASGGKHGAHTEFAAESMFRLAEDAYADYDAIALVGLEASMSEDEQNALLNELLLDKMRGLTQLEKTFGEIVATGAGEWGIAAIVKMGQAYEEMGQALVESDRPTYLTPSQLVEYDGFIDQRIFTQYEKSKTAYALALQKSTELQLYNDDTHLALERLDVLDAEDAPGASEVLIDAHYFSERNASFDYERSL